MWLRLPILEVSMLTLNKRKYVIFCDKDGVFLSNKLLLITGSGQVVLEGSGHFWNTKAFRLAREDKLHEGPSSSQHSSSVFTK